MTTTTPTTFYQQTTSIICRHQQRLRQHGHPSYQTDIVRLLTVYLLITDRYLQIPSAPGATNCTARGAFSHRPEVTMVRTRGQRRVDEQAGIPPTPPASAYLTVPVPSRRTRAKRTQSVARHPKPPKSPDPTPTETVEDNDSKTHIPSVLSLERSSPTASTIPTVVVTHPSPPLAAVPTVVVIPPSPPQEILSATNIAPTVTIIPTAGRTIRTGTGRAARMRAVATDLPVASITPVTRVAPLIPHALLHLWPDATPADLAAAIPENAPPVAMAIPSSLYAEVMDLIARHPVEPQRKVQMNDKLTQTVDSESFPPTSNKRKLANDATMERLTRRSRIEMRSRSPSPGIGRTRRRSTTAQRQALSESGLQAKAVQTPSVVGGVVGGQYVLRKAKRYSDKGNIQLGMISVLVDSNGNEIFDAPPLVENSSFANPLTRDEHPAGYVGLENLEEETPEQVAEELATELASEQAASRQAALQQAALEPAAPQEVFPLEAARRPEHMPLDPVIDPWPHPHETPRRTWGNPFGSLLNSARSVSRYLPGFANSRPELPPPRVREDTTNNTDAITNPPPTADPQDVAQTVSQQHDMHHIDDHAAPATEAAAPRKHHKSRHEHRDKKLHKSNEDVVRERNMREERRFMLEQTQIVMEEDSRRAREATERQEIRRLGEMASTPGGKRKRQPSPETIPNPPGGGYGLDYAYFPYDSSDEEDNHTSPIEEPPNKSRRLDEPIAPRSPSPILGDPHRARPYYGKYFQLPAHAGGNVFHRPVPLEDDISRAADAKIQAMAAAAAYGSVDDTPPASGRRSNEELIARGYLNTPIYKSRIGRPPTDLRPPPSSEPRTTNTFTVPDPSDSDSDPEDDMSGEETSTKATDTSDSDLPAAKAAETWTQPPPPRPNPSHAALPPGSATTDSDALAKARAKALQHLPAKQSSLRFSSRLSSSPMGPEVMDDDHSVEGETEVEGSGALDSPSTGRVDIASGEEAKRVAAGSDEVLQPSAFEEWLVKASPEVVQIIRSSWTDQDTQTAQENFEHGLGVHIADDTNEQTVSEIDTTIIPTTSTDETAFDPNIRRPSINGYINFVQVTDPIVTAFINSSWTLQDAEEAESNFSEQLEAFMSDEVAKGTIIRPTVFA